MSLAYGTYHHTFNPDQHLFAWGARLIYREVIAGGQGTVHDRTDLHDPQQQADAYHQAVHDTLGSLLDAFRQHPLPQSSDLALTVREGPVVACASPQASYGYLYVTVTADI